MSNQMTLQEAVTTLVDAECALARHLDELGVTGVTDNPGSRTSYGTDLFEAMCDVVCLAALDSGDFGLVAAIGCDSGRDWCEDARRASDEDDDPQCAHCGWYRSEHAMSGCTNGFQTEASFQRELKATLEGDYDEDDGRPDEPDTDDDFPMSVEYDGLWGASDWAVEEAAQREAEYEAGLGY